MQGNLLALSSRYEVTSPLIGHDVILYGTTPVSRVYNDHMLEMANALNIALMQNQGAGQTGGHDGNENPDSPPYVITPEEQAAIDGPIIHGTGDNQNDEDD